METTNVTQFPFGNHRLPKMCKSCFFQSQGTLEIPRISVECVGRTMNAKDYMSTIIQEFTIISLLIAEAALVYSKPNRIFLQVGKLQMYCES